jgi:DNA-binding response OmpR family regulator
MAGIAKKRVLLVDDDPELLESVRIALVMRGYEVLTACDGAEALARVERDRPDLMVLDLVMPRRSGLTVLDRIRATAMRSTPIIMMTANDEERHRDAAKLRGVSVFLSKPFAIEQLLTEVDTILNA